MNFDKSQPLTHPWYYTTLKLGTGEYVERIVPCHAIFDMKLMFFIFF